MVYTEQVWHDEPAADTPLSSARLTHLEAGVKEASDRATALEARPIVNSPDDIGAQPVDPDLTAIAALAPLDDAVIQRKAGAWTARTPAQFKSDLGVTKADVGLSNADNTSDAGKPVSTAQQTALNLKANTASLATVATSGAYADLTGRPSIPDSPDDIGAQPLDTDLSVFAALAPTNDDLVQRKAGAWANRTVAQVKTDFGLAAVATSGAYADLVGTVPTSALPALAINDVFTVGSQAAMLALTAQRGDVAIRTDATATFILSSDSPTTLADWKQLPTPTDAVLSVNGQSGVVSLAKGDIGLGAVDNTSDANKPVSTAQQASLDGRQPLDSDLTAIAGLTPTNDDVVQRKAGAWTNRTMAQVKTDLSLVKADVGLSNVDDTSDANKPVSTAQQTALNTKPDATLLDAKGDLFAASAADTAARHAVGTNGQTLVVDLSQTTGLRWSARDRGAYPLSADGLVGASGDLCNFKDNSSLGTPAWMARMLVPAGSAVTTCWTAIHAAGTAGAGGENSFAVYTDAGVLVSSTVSDDTLWSATGLRPKALPSPIAAQSADRYVYVGIRVSGYAVPPSFSFFTSSPNAGLLDGGFGSGRRRSIVVGGSTWVASFDPTSFGSLSSGYMPFIALS